MTNLLTGAAIAAGALVLSACGSGDETQSTVTVTEPAATTASLAPATPPPAGQTAPTVTAPQTGTAVPARPERHQCVRLEPVPDGRYQVFDAGSAVVTFADGRLTLESVTPAEGWTHQVDDEEADEVEIEFRRGADELDLELEIDNGRLEVKICNDDD
ncbi:hypothetical protein QGN32_00225 [Mycolicibacterium sp. ND9-15]|uniref:hypothetical protein n=1 Tax=Mycolicibacterium sp. ND9-15 TaxID=3042320 RepID=UPI002DDC79A3|nr:hypothetical protein [Mycolicibacterium sp. ND9-15]WSE56421.1 hypothetical protein QGN32_00225 [Mycolicibacterium sp. ND9-15]